MKFNPKNKVVKKSSFSKRPPSQNKPHSISKGRKNRGPPAGGKSKRFEKHQQSKPSRVKGMFSNDTKIVTHKEERKV